jgi:CRP-like cAMP-binding protein
VAPSLPTATRNRARTSKRSIPPREPSGSREVTRGVMLSVMQLNSRIRLRGELALGRQELNAKFNLPLTQTQIGNYLGLTAVHVNRMLQSLRDERPSRRQL